MMILGVLCLGIFAGLGLVTIVQDIREDWKLVKRERER